MIKTLIRSKILSGTIFHCRHVDKAHSFKYKIFMLLLNLDELSILEKKFWFMGFEKARPISFWRKDYLPGIQSLSLKEAVKKLVFDKTGTNISGSIFILTHPRWFGFILNPLTLYYCLDSENKLSHVVCEITNTPWNERHCYVLTVENSGDNINTFQFEKAFHVSPFLPMKMDYTWKISNLTSDVTVDIWNHVGGRLDFEAHLALAQEALSGRNLLFHWARDPWITVKTIWGIYWNAGILYFIKRVKFYSHPKL